MNVLLHGLVLLPIVFVSTAISPASAFNILRANGHQTATRAACQKVGITSPLVIDHYVTRVTVIDVHLTAGTERYILGSHFDRNPGMGNAQAFKLGVGYVTLRVGQARNAAKQERTEESLQYICLALHAVQDLASHSSMVDMASQDAQAIVDSMFSDDRFANISQALKLAESDLDQAVKACAGMVPDPPASFIAAGYDPVKNDTNPPNDPFSHDKLAKDTPRTTQSRLKATGSMVVDGRSMEAAGASKYQRAVALATYLSERLLRSLKQGIPAARWQLLVGQKSGFFDLDTLVDRVK